MKYEIDILQNIEIDKFNSFTVFIHQNWKCQQCLPDLENLENLENLEIGQEDLENLEKTFFS